MQLILEDGTKFTGKSIGATNTAIGEIVFNTSMTGYQEIITDPSYSGQIITFTYPEIGNYGCNKLDNEAKKIFSKGIVIKNYSPIDSNSDSEESLEDFLLKNNITGIYGLDTRKLTKRLRDLGSMKAIIADDTLSYDELLKDLKAHPSMEGSDLVSEVSTNEKQNFNASANILNLDKTYNIVALDFGIKANIIKKLQERNLNITLVPAKTNIQEIMNLDPDGIFLSNGPGDPAAVKYAVDTVKKLVSDFHKPIFGICLGHQILSLSQNGTTYKLKFGHKGANHPIKNLENSKIEIASHNHGFAVSKESANKANNLRITHLNINDDTIAGISLYSRHDVFSVQYHPEASPGPHDSDYLFNKFVNLIKDSKN